MKTQQLEYRFLFGNERAPRVREHRPPQAATECLDYVSIPEGLSYLSTPEADQASALKRSEITVVDGESQQRTTAADAALEVIHGAPGAPARRSDVILLESSNGRRTRVNGRPAPLLAVLQVGDQVQPGHGAMLHVTAYRRPTVGPPDQERIGTECAICRVPFSEETRIYECAKCSTVLHCEPEDFGPPEERLECALLSRHCPFCEEPISLDEGYDHVPDA